MNIYIVIPAHNEEAHLSKTLQSLAEQTFLPKKVVVVNDASTDGTQKIIDQFSEEHPFIKGIFFDSEKLHAPGSKVINAFYKGFETVNTDFDIICKFDADLIFPENYLQKLTEHFQKNPTFGMVGGFCTVEKNGHWVLENLTDKDHIRGALKAYRKKCFEQIGGLKKSMGWDTVDELVAQYHGWKVKTDPSLHVKHLKPTGKVYTKASKHKQGEAFYKMRYGFWLTLMASAKLASKKRSFSFFVDTMKGFSKAKRANQEFIVSEKEGTFIRKLRWKNIRRKLGIG
ncbi:glycosyltransferase family A protein [Aequorivita todarodis]|uniref:glycosyltransferase family 2 protein n=1 Tax=Aequorivita todarodis TaxID=2036821 RepID=UPI0023501736|nr:glycosyltransferase family A protein [Aequorivita todarodis]MDC7999629.1 glycosyltransferase family A protein [Aequorivita todarodis]